MHYAPLQPGPLVHTTACLEYAQPQPARPAHHTDIFSTRRLEGWREYFRVAEEKEAQRAREHNRRAHNGKQTKRPSHPRTSPAANSTPHVWPIAHATHPNAQVRCARNEKAKTGEACSACLHPAAPSRSSVTRSSASRSPAPPSSAPRSTAPPSTAPPPAAPHSTA